MKILKIALKQHTPLIHFQHDENDATLRASEVKPKLDRFVFSHLGHGDYQKGVEEAKQKGWHISKGDKIALNYKMEIRKIGERKEYLIASFLSKTDKEVLDKKNIGYIPISPYFAQEKDNKTVIRNQSPLKAWNNIPHKGILYEGAIIYIIGNKELIEYLVELIQLFFLTENFGARQNKGFGSFTVSEISNNLYHKDLKKTPLKNNEILLTNYFDFCYKSFQSYNSLPQLFKKIVFTYKYIKSGNNSPYLKSYIMTYFHDKNIRWEKKYFKQNIKNKFYNKNNQPYELLQHHNPPHNNDGKYLFVRALLGLPNQYEFQLKNPPERNSKLIITVKGDEGVDRFKSPIIFKIINGTIYIVGQSISPSILNRHFDFFVNIQNENKYT